VTNCSSCYNSRQQGQGCKLTAFDDLDECQSLSKLGFSKREDSDEIYRDVLVLEGRGLGRSGCWKKQAGGAGEDEFKGN
jgi:hypothetical protein